MKRNKLIVGIGLLLIGVFAIYGLATAQDEPQFLWEYNIPGKPYDVAVDSDDNVYVTDAEANCIMRFNSAGDLTATWTNYSDNGTTPSFAKPRDVTVDSDGNIYVTQQNNSILKLIITGATGDDELELIAAKYNLGFALCGIAVDSVGTVGNIGDVYVTTTRLTNTILIFDSELSSFSTLGAFSYPLYDIAFDSDGTLYVTEGGDAGNPNRIWKYDGTDWTIWLPDLLNPDGIAFLNPDGLAFDSGDNLYVADTGNNCIQIFNSSKSLLATWTSFSGSVIPFLQNPTGIAIDSDGNVYVADRKLDPPDATTDRILKFGPLCNPIGDLIDLIADVEALDLQKGIDTSLDAKLENAIASLSSVHANQRQDAVNKLEAFINAVEAQTGTHISETEATPLIDAANHIINCL